MSWIALCSWRSWCHAMTWRSRGGMTGCPPQDKKRHVNSYFLFQVGMLINTSHQASRHVGLLHCDLLWLQWDQKPSGSLSVHLLGTRWTHPGLKIFWGSLANDGCYGLWGMWSSVKQKKYNAHSGGNYVLVCLSVGFSRCKAVNWF